MLYFQIEGYFLNIAKINFQQEKKNSFFPFAKLNFCKNLLLHGSNHKVIGSTPVGRTRIFFLRAACVINRLKHLSHIFTRLKIHHHIYITTNNKFTLSSRVLFYENPSLLWEMVQRWPKMVQIKKIKTLYLRQSKKFLHTYVALPEQSLWTMLIFRDSGL